MLTLENILLAQGDFTLRADFTVGKGQKTAIIGPSGEGKSTLLSLIAGFLTPDQGRLLYDGEDITGLAPGKRPVTLLFQDNNLFPHLTAFQNVALGIRPNLRLSEADKGAVQQAIEDVNLTGWGDKKPAKLSGGQQQRVALARCLLRDKPCLLLDEPFAALGPALKTEMLDLVKKIVRQSGATLLMVTHDPEDAKQIADDIVLVSQGHAHPPLPTKQMFANPPQALREYLGSTD